jgi:predicted RNA-binding Zn ribbon-like protein
MNGFRQGSGRLCLDFLRTLRYPGTPAETEELTDPAALAGWVRQLGPCPPDQLPDQRQVTEARRLREAVRELLAAARSGEVARCRPAARTRVNRTAALPPPAPGLDPAGALRWTAPDPVTATLALIARDAVDLVSSEWLHRVRECADPTCGALFLDSSRPGSRRWCAMGTCGNRAKKANLRSRTTAPAG